MYLVENHSSQLFPARDLAVVAVPEHTRDHAVPGQGDLRHRLGHEPHPAPGSVGEVVLDFEDERDHEACVEQAQGHERGPDHRRDDEGDEEVGADRQDELGFSIPFVTLFKGRLMLAATAASLHETMISLTRALQPEQYWVLM